MNDPSIAAFANKSQIFKAVADDAAGWFVPTAVGFFGAFIAEISTASAFFSLAVFAMGALWSVTVIAMDVLSLRKYGYTDGFAKQNLRVIDPEADMTIWKARLLRKSVRKLLVGKYDVLYIGSPDEKQG